MDETVKSQEAGGLPLPSPHRTPSSILALRLVMQTTGYVVDITRHDTIVGRHSDADVRLPLPDISRRHCRFLFGDQGWQVIDLKSTNGIFVNGRKVEQSSLHQGDTLAIGGFNFEVQLGETAAQALSADDPRKAEQVLLSIARALPQSRRDESEKRRAS